MTKATPRETITDAPPGWSPPLTFEEHVKAWLLPPRLYIDRLYRRELRRGERELALVPRLADRARISLDIGANKGVYSYAMLRHSAAVHAFEANPKMVDILRRWGRHRITVHALAIGRESGTANFYIPHSRRGFSNQRGTLHPRIDETTMRIAVPVRRVDDLGLSDIGFMKIDVEGAEMSVLVGARETLRRDRPNLLIETEEIHTGRPIEDAIAEVCSYGYQSFALLDGSLTPTGEIDLDRHHRRPPTRADYLFNFIFLPLPTS